MGSGIRESRLLRQGAAGETSWGCRTEDIVICRATCAIEGPVTRIELAPGKHSPYAARTACPSAAALAKRLAGSSAIAMQITSASGAGTSRASHCSRIFWTRLRVSSRQAKEQQRAKRVNIAADARLPKPILLGRRIGSRAKFDSVGIGAIAPNVRDPQVDNHQRREGHASIGRIPHARYDDVRGFKVAVDYQYPGSPAAAKPACSSPTASHKTGYSPRA